MKNFVIVVNMFLKLKDMQIPHKGGLLLISLFGNPINVVQQYKKAYDSGRLQELSNIPSI